MKIRIGELSRLAACRVVTIRYYEKEGLLRKPERTDTNYRIYDEEDVKRLRFIRHCRLHGMKLSEIRELLSFQSAPSVSHDFIHALIKKHIVDIDAQIASLLRLKSHLKELLSKCPRGSHSDCGILQHFNEKTDVCPDCALSPGYPEGEPKSTDCTAGTP